MDVFVIAASCWLSLISWTSKSSGLQGTRPNHDYSRFSMHGMDGYSWKNAFCWCWKENRPESRMLFILAAMAHSVFVFNPAEWDNPTDDSIGKQKMGVFLEEADLFSPSLSTAREYRCPSCPDWVQYRRSAGAFRRFAVSFAKTPQCALPLSSGRRFLPPYSPTHPFFGPFPDQQRNTRNRSPFLSLRHSVDHRPHRRGTEEEETDEPEQGSP